MNAITPTLSLKGKPLSFADMARIGNRTAHVAADRDALARVEDARAVIEEANTAVLNLLATARQPVDQTFTALRSRMAA